MSLNAIVLFALIFISESVTCFDIKLALDDLADVANIVGNVVNAVNECEFTCPQGWRRVHNPDYRPSANGCGSYGFEVRFDKFPELTGCCNKHDHCYDTCGSDKTVCDKTFKKCIQDFCTKLEKKVLKNTMEVCKSTAKVMYGGTAVLGCAAFTAAQEKACLCLPDSGHSRRTKKRHWRDYEI